MDQQLQLAVRDKPERKLSQASVDRVKSVLAGRGWMTGRAVRKALADLTGRLPGERLIRRAASQSNGEILSGPDSPGYMLTREATPEDRDAAVGPL